MSLLDDILNTLVIDGIVTSQNERENITCLQKIMRIDSLIREYNKKYTELNNTYNSVLNGVNNITKHYPVNYNFGTISENAEKTLPLSPIKTTIFIQYYSPVNESIVCVYVEDEHSTILAKHRIPLTNRGMLMVTIENLPQHENNQSAFITIKDCIIGSDPGYSVTRNFTSMSWAKSLRINVEAETSVTYWCSTEGVE